jgi:hypothetical protein
MGVLGAGVMVLACVDEVRVGRVRTDAGPPGFIEPDAALQDDYPGCETLTCGASCAPRDIGIANLRACNYYGACVDRAVTCDVPDSVDPCAGKACGEACVLCTPDIDVGCSERLVPKSCDRNGRCVEGRVACP